MKRRQIYMDYAATTPMDSKVVSAMLPYLSKDFGNPSNFYSLGRKANEAVLKSKNTISKILGCSADEFVFTAGATESDNLAILGVARANRDKGNKIIVSQIEHKGILAACDALEKEGFEIVKLPVGKDGIIDLKKLKKELDSRTILVSVTTADSETGTIQPVSEISKIIGGKAIFHTDASQAAGYLDINVKRLGVDLMTLSAHKIYGPKGIGGLYVRKGVKLKELIYGGGQQGKLRSGTENVPGIVGFAGALELVQKNKKTESSRLKKLRDKLEKEILKNIPKVLINGSTKNRLPNFLNISILDVEGEALLLLLDKFGIMISTGSACNSFNLEPSYILAAMGRQYEHIHGSLRFSLGKNNTSKDIDYVLEVLPEAVEKLRSISSLNLSLSRTKWQRKLKSKNRTS